MTVADDGIFFMAMKDFYKGFVQFDKVFYRNDWKTTKKSMKDSFETDVYQIYFSNPVDQ